MQLYAALGLYSLSIMKHKQLHAALELRSLSSEKTLQKKPETTMIRSVNKTHSLKQDEPSISISCSNCRYANLEGDYSCRGKPTGNGSQWPVRDVIIFL